MHPQLAVLLPQRDQLRALVLTERSAVAVPLAAGHRHPVAQGALVDPEVPGHLRDRLTGLEHQPDRAGLEVLVELPVLPHHRRPPSKGAMSPRYEGKPTRLRVELSGFREDDGAVL